MGNHEAVLAQSMLAQAMLALGWTRPESSPESTLESIPESIPYSSSPMHIFQLFSEMYMRFLRKRECPDTLVAAQI